MGLVVFTIIGCQVGQQIHLPHLIVLFSGMITGCAGGVLRDVLCNEVPFLFRKEIYASAAIVTGAVYIGIEHFHGSEMLATVLAAIIGLTLRLLSIRYEWHMPKFVYRDEWHYYSLGFLVRSSEPPNLKLPIPFSVVSDVPYVSWWRVYQLSVDSIYSSAL